MTIALEFIAFFAFIFLLGYLLPAGQFYYLFHVRHTKENETRRIQHRNPLAGQVWREIRLSLMTIAIFAAMATALFQFYKAGKTSIYLHFSDHPLWYLPLSFFLCLLIHDTYFYWTHRFMHLPRVFKYFHLGHHRSVTPTPWAIFAFQPLEALLQFIGIGLLVLFLPLHPLVLLAFLWYDTLINTAGHTGYEMMPKTIASIWPFKALNTVTHHDHHHTNTRVNFGAFFNIWDRLMGTFQDDSTAVPAGATAGAAKLKRSTAGTKLVPQQSIGHS